ncbi:hypothetical protein [Alicyclobacillus mengziensis]|uniref:Uncharacterized protein n=1 Tax=Alicyclobacillus mengziensis TaxID=2931921 RepID=A0A9X7Z609_9BACL|nr:hypothetical protein [Alicyclobacillus mengziensis]QSO45811.1 hypothetical protein JZ786_14820 [Alicyclobacillus mengziensis]
MTRFLYQKIVIDTVSNSSVVSYGENLQTGFTCVEKKNDGLGKVDGTHNVMVNNIHFVRDKDEIDAWRNQVWGQRDET